MNFEKNLFVVRCDIITAVGMVVKLNENIIVNNS